MMIPGKMTIKHVNGAVTTRRPDEGIENFRFNSEGHGIVEKTISFT
jgi:hypothetical protein